MPDELTQVEAAYRAVARCQGRVVCLHPTLPELPALFGMPNQGFNASAAIGKAGTSLRLTLRKTPIRLPGRIREIFGGSVLL
jgi:hypothetical protein